MKIVILGSGNLATQLSLSLVDAGCAISQIFSRNISHASELASKLNGLQDKRNGTKSCCSEQQPFETKAIDDVSRIAYDADAYITAVKDDAVGELASTVCLGRDNGVFLHTAGSVPMDVFSGKAKHYGVLYPMQSFSKDRRVDFAEIPIFIEGNDTMAVKTIETIAQKVSQKIEHINSDQRRKLHLAAVFASNLPNHCYRLAERIVEAEGLDFKAFQPLIIETARKVGEMSPKLAQTGPMVRNDVTIMQRQMDMIDDSLTKEIYQLMAKSIYEDSQK